MATVIEVAKTRESLSCEEAQWMEAVVLRRGPLGVACLVFTEVETRIGQQGRRSELIRG
jgi:hypothetical protein